MPSFDLRDRWAESSDFGPKYDDLDHRILIKFIIVGFCTVGLRKKTDYFLRSKNENLKLGIGSHENQPDAHSCANPI